MESSELSAENETVLCDETKCQFDLEEAKGILASLSLTSVSFEDYLIILRSEFDVSILGQPYLALMLLFNVKSGKYISRIWNQTTSVGTAHTLEQFMEACQDLFGQGKPCVGCIEDEEGHVNHGYLVSHTPVSRKVSTTCRKVLGKTAKEETQSCSECLRLIESKLSEQEADTMSCKVVILPDEEKPGKTIGRKRFRNSNKIMYKEEEPVEVKSDLDEDHEISISSDNDVDFNEDIVPLPEEPNGKECLLLEFLLQLLNDRKYEDCIKWKDKESGVFKIVDSAGLSELWGIQRNHHSMNFDKMSRALRYYYKVSKLKKVPEQYCYQLLCGPDEVRGVKNVSLQRLQEEDPSREIYKSVPGSKVKCPWCSQMFKKRSGTFALHRKIKHFWGVFKCPQCKVIANFASDMVNHMQREEHTEEPSIDCPKCKNKFPMLQVGPHYEGCILEGNTKCRWCNKKFNGMSGGLDMHRKRKHFWGVFKCPECKVALNFARDLLVHMEKEKHITDPFANCPKCKEKLPLHELGKHYEECVLADTKVSKDKDTTCSICLEVFSNTNSIYRHKKKQHFWGVFNCPTCHERADFARDMIDHIQAKGHTLDPYIACPTCKDKFHMMEIVSHYEVCVIEDLRQKDREVRKKKKPVSCTTCGKAFKRRKDYRTHLKTHLRAQGVSEEDAQMTLYYYCDRCGKRFTQVGAMKRHIQHVHEGVYSQSTCPVCLLTFDTQAKMYKHKYLEHSSDEKYQCEDCGKHCGNPSTLRAHMRKHEEPQFKCSFCEKMLKSKDTLVAHEREHIGERPFKCTICSKGFTSSSSLTTHTKHVHKIITPGMKPIEKRVRKK